MTGRVVLTGAAGLVGSVLRESLSGTYDLAGVDRVDIPGFSCHRAELSDFSSALPGFAGADVVVHLAAEPRHTPDIWWDRLIPDNILATANAYEAARQSGARRFIFFSSMHVNGTYERAAPYNRIVAGDYEGLDPDNVPLVTHEMAPGPDGPYAASKLFGEDLGRYYASDHGMSVVCLRLGTIGRSNRPGGDPRDYVSFCSHRDLAQLVSRCIEWDGVGHDVFFAASGNTWKVYDTPRAYEVMGYRPSDNAEDFRPG